MISREQSEEIMGLTTRFVDLANELKDAGHKVELVNTALQLASGTYATYLAAGNDGYLKGDGVDKVAAAYERNLKMLQDMKKQQLNPEGKE